MNSQWQFCSVKQLLRLPCMKNQKLKFKGEISETGVEFVTSLINSKYTLCKYLKKLKSHSLQYALDSNSQRHHNYHANSCFTVASITFLYLSRSL